ncbi:hypothetical protein DEF98_001740 [Xanthomonas vasicola]|nr:hypothetical protein KWO_015545 [Xanthomonas vasicola pv. musacearum NCPPB 4379]RJL87728.1 hypothetical protein DEG03_000140 [Xanthomonas vasicola]RJL90247.1 hypothetical protein DEF98_001740 [Xanthomonas vasicola]RJL96259.1 hypothetical protein DEG05_011265 [Xanthomonas vasicola]RJN14050.1 hypothetical protein DEG00_000140 [Xanthomonas vasicola]
MRTQDACSQTLSGGGALLAQKDILNTRPNGARCLMRDTAGGMQKIPASRETHDVLIRGQSEIF